MASKAGAIRAGKAFVEMYVDDSKVRRQLALNMARFRAFGSQLKSMGQQIATFGVAAAAPFALSLKTFAGFESQMSRVKALTGASGKEFDALKEKAKALGETTVFSASQAAEAMGNFAMAGYEPAKILEAIGPALDLAAAGKLDIADAAGIVTKMMNGMGLSAADLANTVDVMAKAMTTADTDLSMLGEAFRYVGPMAKTAGVSLEEITAAIQMLSNAGIQGEMAGSTLRGMLLALTSPSAEAGKELQRLGVKVNDAQGNVRSLADIFADLENAMGGMGSGDKLKSLGTIFPARQAAGAAELVAQGSAMLRAGTQALRDATGTSARIAGEQIDNLSGDWTIMTSALEGVQIAVGETLGGLMRLGTQGITDLLGRLTEWIKQNQLAVVSLAAVAVGSVAAGVALIGVGASIGALSFIAGTLVTVLKGVASAVAFLFSPAGLIVAGVTTAIGLFAKWIASGIDWIGIVQNMEGAWSAFSAAVASGDLEKAAKIAFSAIKLAWLEVITELRIGLSEFSQSIHEVGSALGELAGGQEGRVADTILRHKNDRAKLRRELSAAREEFRKATEVVNHPGDLPDEIGKRHIVPITKTPPADFSLGAEALGTQRRLEGTFSSMSDRMFGSNDKGTTKKLDTIATNTKQTAEELRRLSRNAIIYRS